MAEGISMDSMENIRPLDTSKRMIESREREKKGRRRDI